VRDSAAQIVFNYVFNLERFELPANTTYPHYVSAINSNRVTNWKLLPPEYSVIQVLFRFCCPDHKLHFDFPGKGSWHGEYYYEFKSDLAAICALVA